MGEVISATSRLEVSEAIEFREATLVGDDRREPSSKDEYDDDPTTVQCLVRDDDGLCIGTGRLVAPIDVEREGEVIHGNPTIGPITVAPHARGRGIGRAILSFLEEEALATYGHNGVVQVEAFVSSGVAEGAGTVGYTVREGEGGVRPASTKVFRDVTVDDNGDSRGGPAVA
ncbi:MAG: GNAT family N-acetyltransferase [Demequinaceae bacterium]|nr:GNAT family N-acetyltransferase [Demequinaceae bacterium]